MEKPRIYHLDSGKSFTKNDEDGRQLTGRKSPDLNGEEWLGIQEPVTSRCEAGSALCASTPTSTSVSTTPHRILLCMQRLSLHVLTIGPIYDYDRLPALCTGLALVYSGAIKGADGVPSRRPLSARNAAVKHVTLVAGRTAIQANDNNQISVSDVFERLCLHLACSAGPSRCAWILNT